jgi:hypothetical protein
MQAYSKEAMAVADLSGFAAGSGNCNGLDRHQDFETFAVAGVVAFGHVVVAVGSCFVASIAGSGHL